MRSQLGLRFSVAVAVACSQGLSSKREAMLRSIFDALDKDKVIASACSAPCQTVSLTAVDASSP
jgi:hypothetical protein